MCNPLRHFPMRMHTPCDGSCKNTPNLTSEMIEYANSQVMIERNRCAEIADSARGMCEEAPEYIFKRILDPNFNEKNKSAKNEYSGD